MTESGHLYKMKSLASGGLGLRARLKEGVALLQSGCGKIGQPGAGELCTERLAGGGTMLADSDDWGAKSGASHFGKHLIICRSAGEF